MIKSERHTSDIRITEFELGGIKGFKGFIKKEYNTDICTIEFQQKKDIKLGKCTMHMSLSDLAELKNGILEFLDKATRCYIDE